ncbi:MAG: relaxase domain-containing protein, partial [Sulfitobacter sp.]|nr:relaxase domain-containing protein [Sulfitobacter sp.]
WLIERVEADRFARARRPQQVVWGYDVTFSVQKSVSVLWAASTPEVQAVIEAGFSEAVDAGMAYLEDEGFWVRQGRGEQGGRQMIAAAYRHHSSRALEPQLHDHVVIANMAHTDGGEVRAVDARGLMAHATTAGHIADAALRRSLSARLGVGWTEAERASAEIVGVPAAAMRAMSSRRAQVMDVAGEVGAFTARGRQTVALMTRPDKQIGVDGAELAASWRRTLAGHGLGAEAAAELTPAVGEGRRLVGLSHREQEQLLVTMSGPEGVTKYAAVFDRRDVIAYVADRVGGRVATSEIVGLADGWIAQGAVALEFSNSWQSIGAPGARVALSHHTVYSTPEMVGIEQRVLERHRAGLGRGASRCDPAIVEAAIRRLEDRLGSELGADQAAAVRSITTSGHQFQAVQGLAGAGKTTTMAAAVDAWQESGLRVIGAAPFGTAARTLGDEIGIETRTVEGLLAYIGHNGPDRILDAATVVLVDEASTISTRQLGALYHAAAQTGATVRTVGDPQQHSAVEAGGLWSALVAVHDTTTPVLDVNRRQNPETLAAVREALDSYRHGDIGAALETLAGDGRVVTAESWPELLDDLAGQWFEHHVAAVDAGRAPSQMVAERNRDRAELNERAQTLLRGAGRLGPGFEIGDQVFHVGDRVVAQEQHRDLRPEGASHHDRVLNGSTGTVTGFAGPETAPDPVVDFDGLGEIRVPHQWVAAPIGAGRGGGLAPAYAVTSYKAQGKTYDAALGLAAPGAVDRPGMYVTLTRGRDDLKVFSIDPNQTPERVDAEIPSSADTRTMTAALRDSLTRPGRPEVATVADTGIAAALDALTPTGRSQAIAQARIAGGAIADPDPVQVAVLGARPDRRGAHQQVWDRAVAGQAIYAHRYQTLGRNLRSEPVPAVAPELSAAHDTDHQAMTAFTLQARRAAVAAMALEDLLGERDEHAGANAQHLHRRLSVAVGEAEQDLVAAQRNLERVRVLARPAGLTRSPPAGAAAQVEQATRRCEVAGVRVDSARHALSELERTGQPSAARAQLVEDAFTWRINTATRHPARYLVDVIGPRPAKGVGEWERAAHLIERVRHNHGLTPNHGPLPGPTPLDRAVGAHNATWPPLVRAVHAMTQQARQGPEPGPEHGGRQR